ncbi:MAG: cytochrome c maturation protein CcmE [bacterium]
MDPSRKRKIRLVVSLSVAVLLAAGLVYTSFSASTEAREPSEIIGSTSGSTYELTGKVVNDTVVRRGEDLSFRIRDREGTENLPVAYSGTIPDAFREGREVIVTGSLEGGVFVAERDSLVTKCPSKFTAEEKS